MSEHLALPDPITSEVRSRQDADTIAEDLADLAAADGKWEAVAQGDLDPAGRKRLTAVAAAAREQIDDEFYHAFIK